MRIAMVSEHASPLATLGGVDAGGQNVHVAELAAGFARRGHEVRVYTRRDDPGLPPEVDADAGYRVVHVPAGPPTYLPKDELPPFLGRFSDFLRRHWATDPPDIVHAHFWMSGLAAESAAAGIPLVQTFHALGSVKRRYQGLADTSPRSRVRSERRIAAQASHIIATCSDEVAELGRMGVPRYRTSVVPCGVDLTEFTPAGPVDERGASRRVVAIGRMVPRKGFDTAIAALPELPDTELVIAGGGDDDDESRRLRKIATECGVRERVRLLGAVSHDRMPALLRSADVVLCTPWYEPFGIVPLEAMACGRPVVATAVGGMLDTVVDGVTGSLVSSSDPHTVAAAVRPILEDAALRESMGAAGFRRACEHYSWQRVTTDTLAVYHRVMTSARTRRVAR
ncbi:glycosyltransferase [Nocardia otitidiscaviarum]|uniref:glycosyltransferase n=1 Tax=Nocardia otitidiscaviarum TaxID=1823 RepID=UPI002456E67D|nr:glycosyltransferase [Nocardia otitidiscaviarum]